MFSSVFVIVCSYVVVAIIAIMIYRGIFVDSKIRANLYITGENEAHIALYDKDIFYNFHNAQLIYVRLIDLRDKL